MTEDLRRISTRRKGNVHRAGPTVQVDELAEELEVLDAQEAAVAASGGVDDTARRVGAGSRNGLGAGARRTGWRSASSLR